MVPASNIAATPVRPDTSHNALVLLLAFDVVEARVKLRLVRDASKLLKLRHLTSAADLVDNLIVGKFGAVLCRKESLGQGLT